MFSNGNVTLYVADMERAIRFYTETLGLRLVYRFANNWATVEVGRGLTIGLHPASAEMPAGRRGSMAIGLELGDVLIEEAVSRLTAKGVQFHGPVNDSKAGKFVSFDDPDGNLIYLAELNRSHVDQGEGKYQYA
jgi:catechol 2,3-dioxygenase-like lactoylglutathione lyase family enzyme